MAYDRESDPDVRDQKPSSAEKSQDSSDESASSEARAETKSKAAGDERRTGGSRRHLESSRQRSYDEDDDDEDEDEDEDEEDEEEREVRRAAARRAKARRQAARSRGPRRKLNIPKTEEELNVPKLQTIGMLGSVSALMIIMWFAAKLACNAHPDHLREPRYVSVSQLARDPKNAALEFQTRFTAKDYLLAGEIASGPMADKIHELLTFCEANTDVCERDQIALKDKVTGTAALMDSTPAKATVEITTYVNGASPKTVTLDLVPVGQVWKVTQSRDGSLQPVDADAAAATHPTVITQ